MEPEEVDGSYGEADERWNWRIILAAALLVLAFVIFLAVALLNSQQDDRGSGQSPQPPAASASPLSAPEPGTVEPAADDPLSGTWTMFETGADGTERQAFTLEFIGANAGTVEILEDVTESDATFEFDGTTVSFSFTRIFTLDMGDWSETSTFGGKLVGENEILGQYVREDWSCLPDRAPPCAYEKEPLRFPSRLVREP